MIHNYYAAEYPSLVANCPDAASLDGTLGTSDSGIFSDLSMLSSTPNSATVVKSRVSKRVRFEDSSFDDLVNENRQLKLEVQNLTDQLNSSTKSKTCADLCPREDIIFENFRSLFENKAIVDVATLEMLQERSKKLEKLEFEMAALGMQFNRLESEVEESL